MKIFTIFFYKILAKHSPERTTFKNFPERACLRTPPRSAMQLTPLFPKKYFDPPPPRNEILDTPLSKT